jgi:hypothetical protein
MIHHRAAAGQCSFAKPSTMFRWIFAVIDPIDSQNPPKAIALIESEPPMLT